MSPSSAPPSSASTVNEADEIENEVLAAAGGAPLAPIHSSDSTVISIPLDPASSVADPNSHTLKKRPWRIRSTEFSQILAHRYHGKGTEEEPFIIEWLPQDHENPQTYPELYKWFVIMVVAIATLAVALASSAYSGAVDSIIEEFKVKEIMVVLGVSLFVLGFACGPLLWAPASEVFGRRNTFILSYVIFTAFNAGAAGANSMNTLLVLRFFAGAFGSSPLTNAGGTVADVLDANERGLGMAIFAAAPFLGPAPVGPITGGFLGDAYGWRWVEGYIAIFSGTLAIIGIICIPETYAPTLLRRRAALLQKVTGKVYRAPSDAKGLLSIKALMKTSLSRPWKLLFTEAIVAAISIYMACVYGTLYMLFAAFPIVFQQGHGWNAGVGGLAFLGVLVGMLISVAYTIFVENPRYVRVAKAAGGRAAPEARLPVGIAGGVCLVVGLAWFAGSAGPKVHWIVPILAGVPFGAGLVFVFLSLMNYLIDAYTVYAASVLAANSVLRSLFGMAFPLFTTDMYKNLGVNWASAVPGFLALACFPFSIIFWKYGARIRAKSTMSVEADRILASMMRPRAPPAETKEVA
ncbi:hypothetical protein RQP46_007997 [Phenoliferia psychrophenolica]